MSGLTRLAVVALGAMLAIASTVAAPSAVDSTGRVHEVETVLWTEGSRIGGTALRYVVQDADGSIHAEIVPGTDDLRVDREPSLALDPITEDPIIVWSRNTGTDFDVRLTRLGDDGWREPISITSGPGEDVDPQLSARRELIHIVWTTRRAGACDTPYRLSLWRASLDPAFGPEELPRTTPVMISADGGTDPDPKASTTDLTYFASGIHDPGSADDSIVVWGIRDEPLPITYVQAFEVPRSTDGARDEAAGWRGGRLVMSFVAGGALRYSVREDGVWTDLRLIELDSETDATHAIRLVEQMNLRNLERSLPK